MTFILMNEVKVLRVSIKYPKEIKNFTIYAVSKTRRVEIKIAYSTACEIKTASKCYYYSSHLPSGHMKQ